MNHTAKLTNHTAKLMNYTAKSINHTASNQRTTSPCQKKTYILHRAGQCILDNTHKLHWSDREMEANQRRAAMLVHAKKKAVRWLALSRAVVLKASMEQLSYCNVAVLPHGERIANHRRSIKQVWSVTTTLSYHAPQ